MIQHNQVSTSVVHWASAVGHDKTTRSLSLSPYAFDVSILEIFGPSVKGGTVCTSSDWERLNSLAESVQQLRANFVFFTPSLLGTLTHETFPTLTTMIIGGEWVSGKILTQWMDRGKHVFEGYGPTEATIFVRLVDTS